MMSKETLVTNLAATAAVDEVVDTAEDVVALALA